MTIEPVRKWPRIFFWNLVGALLGVAVVVAGIGWLFIFSLIASLQ